MEVWTEGGRVRFVGMCGNVDVCAWKHSYFNGVCV